MVFTADLYDEFTEEVNVADPIFQAYGGKKSFFGRAETLRVYEDNSLVRTLLSEPGLGKVLVVDGGGSLRCALVGDRLAELAITNGWEGIIVTGCIRDSAQIATMSIGIKALNTNPRKSVKRNVGLRGESVTIGGVEIAPGDFIYSDSDGVLVSKRSLLD